jgi:hypothetical protein
MPPSNDAGDARKALDDAVTFPFRTIEVASGGGSTKESARGNGTGSLTRTAQETIRSVLGWRYRGDDVKGFLAALGKSFESKQANGQTEWLWKPQSYAVSADLGEITGAQASIHKQASVAVEQALPLLDGLVPLRADVDTEDTASMRELVASELRTLVDELAQSGGPRVLRVDLAFLKLLGNASPNQAPDPEAVSGQLGQLRVRFGLDRDRVNSVAEEQAYTNFFILVDYVFSLFQSWCGKRAYFTRRTEQAPEPFLGTQLVLLSQALEVIVEQVQETYFAMDSVFFGAAERQVTLLELMETRISVGELLGWVEAFAASEGPQLLQDAGKDGVVAFHQTIHELTKLVKEAAAESCRSGANPVPAFHTKRVEVSLKALAVHLDNARELASKIDRTLLVPRQDEGENENEPLSEFPLKFAAAEPTEPRRRTSESRETAPNPAGKAKSGSQGE